MRFFDGVNGRMHYRRWTVRQPRAVLVLLHGLGQQSADYHRFARAMNRYDIEVWGLDHAGHGLSEGSLDRRAPIEELAANALGLVELARHEHDGLPLVLLGHSLGAGTALIAMQSECEAAAAVAAVVLIGTPGQAEELRVPAPPVPTLALHGRDDRRAPIDPMRRWSTGKPMVRLLEFADAGHDLLHEPIRREIARTIVDFVQRETAHARVARVPVPV
ncbi:alpha/beta hydrolase [Nocardia blacklockiae]|uniref:alpha/beta hydrolase n=1 Tax=Nocardia blacklockiae TaxID=480036 RepID=UPI001895C269|nr:alpha/beta fold hydrolase [Nocardia blacklockiae]MBF6175310.1 alpha/beta fold hydrolase [Nocardia blacklockiae]